MDLAALAVELCTLPPSEFTAARDARAKEARSGGDAELARRIGRLPKPSAPAWAINMLATHRPTEIDAVLELGAALRTAQEEQDRTALRELGQQRPRVLAGAVEQAREVADGLGIRVSDAAAGEIERTLRAAMTDPHAALAVRSGQLVRALATDGIDAVDLDDAVAVPGALPLPATLPGVPSPAQPGAAAGTPSERALAAVAGAAERARISTEAAVQEAERSAAAAEAELADAERQHAEARSRRDQLAADVRQAKEELVHLQQELANADQEAAAAGRGRTLAGRRAERARRTAETARGRLKDPG
ncbi:hypothetical protein [Arthrobacter cavernae]|uniref:Uncharacterized protein n=1 Tax=Arthrobacter cavernae TaxID=2817681 RepID=A0A939HEI2_9MICC|nr:hypothetical protein [Arthrobacter cavernae]MBO1269447.1 hypothetical protein [Arthrobacter cavernae]